MRSIPRKDVDCFSPVNVGLLMQGRPRFLPCTPHGIVQLLHRTGHSVAGKHVVVVGRSDIVGKPMAMMLAQRDGSCGREVANATVTIAHSRTEDLAEVCRTADCLIAAVGVPEMIKGDMIKPGAVVIDVGINRVDDKLVGDVAFEEAKQVASAITPVPGGVGPLTIAMLLHNTLLAATVSQNPYSLPAAHWVPLVSVSRNTLILECFVGVSVGRSKHPRFANSLVQKTPDVTRPVLFAVARLPRRLSWARPFRSRTTRPWPICGRRGTRS